MCEASESSIRCTTKDLTLTVSHQGVRCERIKQTLGGCREGWGVLERENMHMRMKEKERGSTQGSED